MILDLNPRFIYGQVCLKNDLSYVCFLREKKWKVEKSLWDTPLFIRVWNTLESTIEQAVTKLLIDPVDRYVNAFRVTLSFVRLFDLCF